LINKVDWHENIGRSCEFVGQNLTHYNLEASKCSDKCAETQLCTHFMWNRYKGGTCWLKKGFATKKDAIRISSPYGFCGICTNKTTPYFKLEETPLGKFTKCYFQYGRDYTNNGADKSDYSKYSYITIWLGSIRTKCYNKYGCTNFNKLYHGAMLNETIALNKTPVFYSFIIGFEASNVKFLSSNCDSSPNLCQKGSQFIRTNKKHILEKYRHQSYNIANYITKKGFCIFLIEPDFWNYYGYQSQLGGPLTGKEMRSLFDEIVSIIKSYLPNAAIAWHIKSNLTEDEMKIWWDFFKNSSNIDFIYTSDGFSHGETSQIIPDNLTWKFMSSLTGKKIIADSGYGMFHSHSNNRAWYNPVHVNDRISDDVIAVTLILSKKNPRLHKKIC